MQDLRTADVGKTLRVEVTATKEEDASAKARSAPTGVVVDVSGAPVAVPAVVGLPVSEATALLAENFQVIRLTAGEPVISCNPPVTDQSPNEGSTLERGEAVLEVTDGGLVLKEVAADTTIEAVKAATGAELIVEHEPGVF